MRVFGGVSVYVDVCVSVYMEMCIQYKYTSIISLSLYINVIICMYVAYA